MARFGVLFDACVLVPIGLADTFLRLADREMFRPMWSTRIFAEVRSAVLEIHPEIDPSRIDTRLRSMDLTFPDACVSGWEGIESSLDLPDENDRHVLAAALRGRADVIVTANLRDFPSDVIDEFGVLALSPDDFLLDQLDLAPDLVMAALEDQARDTRRPPKSLTEILDMLERCGAPEFATAARLRN